MLRLAAAGSSTKCPKQWSKALHVSSNKTAVVTFLVDEWQRGKYAPLIGRHSLFVTSGEQCWLFRTGAGDGNSVQPFHVQELECSHEEADTKICYMLSMLPKQGTAQSLFALPTLMWQSLPVAGQISAQLILQTGTAQRM